MTTKLYYRGQLQSIHNCPGIAVRARAQLLAGCSERMRILFDILKKWFPVEESEQTAAAVAEHIA